MELITQEDMQKILNEAKENLQQKTMDAIRDQIVYSMKFSLESAIEKQVDLFMKNELAPSIAQALSDNKPIMVEAAVQAANGLAVEISRAMVNRVVDTMGSPYKRNNVFKALFGD